MQITVKELVLGCSHRGNIKLTGTFYQERRVVISAVVVEVEVHRTVHSSHGKRGVGGEKKGKGEGGTKGWSFITIFPLFHRPGLESNRTCTGYTLTHSRRRWAIF